MMVRLAENLCDRFDLHIGVVADTVGAPVCAEVRTHTLGAERVSRSAGKIIKLIRELRPDIVVSGMYHLNLLCALVKPLLPAGTLVLLRQNGSPDGHAVWGSQALARLLYRTTYRRSDGVICQSAAMAREMANLAGKTTRLYILPNPVQQTVARLQGKHWNGPGPHLLAVGRLAKEKGFDLLLDAAAALRPSYPSLKIVVLGGGAEMATLRNKAAELGLGEVVRFEGQVSNPEEWFHGCSAFVLPSRQDAMPNALLEAALAGLPIVANPASAGLVDLIRGQSGVWLGSGCSAAGTLEALRECLASIGPSERFEHAWAVRFKAERAAEQWESLFHSLLSSKHPAYGSTPGVAGANAD